MSKRTRVADALATPFDVVVIGSGLGGLTVASLEAQLFGRRVLVLERHHTIGGFSHTFRRPGGHRFDVGLHYVGQVGHGGGFERAFEVVTGHGVRWTKMPDPFERFVFPGFEFGVRSGDDRFRADLVAAFPAEAAAIDRYLADLAIAVRWLRVLALRGVVPWPIQRAMARREREAERLATMTTGEYLATRVRDPKLRAVLAAQWGDYGLPPSESAFLIHAVTVRHYLFGGYYPAGTSRAIGEGATRVIEAHGGVVLPSHEVRSIRVRRGRATGVVVRRGSGARAEEAQVDARRVVSDAGARATYLRLLDPSVPVPFRDALARVPPGYANVTLYLGLSRSPAEIGVTGANHWLFADADHDATWRRRNSLVEGDPSFAYLSFPSMKDPEAKVHAAQVVAQLDASAFAAWADRPWMRRGADYEALKQRIADALIAFVDRRVPGLAGLVETRELSTPLSTAHFTGHFGGEIYGLPATPARFASPWAQIGTPVKGLYLTGADAVAHGFGGALMSGMLTVGAMEGLVGLAKVLWATRSRDAD